MKLEAGEIIRRAADARTYRSAFENDWREVARHVLPSEYGRWSSQMQSQPYDNTLSIVRRTIYDTTGMRALPKFAALLERILTPQGHTWHRLRASDDKLMQRTAVIRYFDDLNARLFLRRYEPRANFQPVQMANYLSLGAYGNGCKFITARKDRLGLLYQSVPLQQCYFMQDDEGRIDTAFRRLWLSTRQCAQKFGDDKLPDKIAQSLKDEKDVDNPRWEIIHCVAPRDDYADALLDGRRFKFMSAYVAVDDKAIIDSGDKGFHSFPFIVPRHLTVDNSVYAYSIAQQALGGLNTVNQMKKSALRQGQKAVDPVLLAHDDGVISGRFDMRPGAVNYGGVNSQGQQLIHALPPGDLALAEKMIEMEQDDIKDAFFVTLFEILVEKEDMSATEVMQRAVDKATLLAPTMGMIQCSDIGPMIEREIDVLADLGQLPDMPPELQEAQGEYAVGYTSPLAKTMSAEETKGFIDIVQFCMEYAAQTGDKTPLQRFNFDRALPDIAYERGLPSRWLNSDQELAAAKQAAQQQQQTENMGRVAPAVAGAAKAVAGMPPGALQQLGIGGGGGGAVTGGMPPPPAGLPALPPPIGGAPGMAGP